MDNQELISYIFIGGGVILIMFFIYTLTQAKKTKHWHSVKGTIAYMRVEKNERRHDDPVTYKLDTSYKYTVDGIEYTSKRVFYGDFIHTSDSDSLKQKVLKHTRRSEIEVFYDPQNPASSVLEPGVNPAIYFTLLAGVIFITISILMRYIEFNIT